MKEMQFLALPGSVRRQQFVGVMVGVMVGVPELNSLAEVDGEG